MQYQVLARKWRPRNFEQLVGQEHVLKALVNGLDQDRLHHAYLFTGTRGVGKTTIARILAKCLNCEEGVSSVPCDVCPSCTEINEGRCVDLIEVDAASRTKVEDTRELLDNVQYAPTRCRYKIYLIDEVHMLSNHSFNALLKTLEEPPPHIKFLLATTDPQKLPITILSRCLQFNLKNLAPERIVEHLRHVLGEENVPFEDAALWHLGRAADGSMRDALSLTDQGIAYGQNTLRADDVASMLGTIDRARIYRVLDALCNADAGQVLAEVASLAEFSPDYPALLEELISVLHRIAVAQAVPDSLDDSIDARDRIEDFAARLSGEDLQLYYQIALIGRRDLPLNPDPRAGLEMILLRMLAFQPTIGAPVPPKKKPQIAPTEPGDSSACMREERTNAEAHRVPDPVAQAAQSKQPKQPKQPTQSTRTTEPVKSSAREALDTVQAQLAVARDDRPVPEASPPEIAQGSQAHPRSRAKLDLVVDNPPRAPATNAGATAPVSGTGPERETTIETASAAAPEKEQVSPAGKLSALKTNEDWIQVVQQLPVRGMTRNILGECVLESCENGRLGLLISAQYIELLTDVHRERITEALLNFYGQSVTLDVAAAAHEQETPAAWLKRMQEARIAQARKSLEQDPVVQQLIQQFGARLVDDSIFSIADDE